MLSPDMPILKSPSRRHVPHAFDFKRTLKLKLRAGPTTSKTYFIRAGPTTSKTYFIRADPNSPLTVYNNLFGLEACSSIPLSVNDLTFMEVPFGYVPVKFKDKNVPDTFNSLGLLRAEYLSSA
jgi:hypothetical protein